MQLKDWLREMNMTQEEFAARVETSQSTIARIISHDGRPPRRRPSISLAGRIYRETKGMVPPDEFLDGLPEVEADEGPSRDQELARAS